MDAWRAEYNTLRPHHALDMAIPVERFTPVPVEQRAVLGLWRPPELASTSPGPDIPESRESIDDEPDDEATTTAAGGPVPASSDIPTTEQPARTLDAVAGDAVESTGSCRVAATSRCVASSSGWVPRGRDARSPCGSTPLPCT